MKNSAFDKLEKVLHDSNLGEETVQNVLDNFQELAGQKVNLMIVGGTGVGKSSTINAIFGENIATVGESFDPETVNIEEYKLGNLVLWDTPGLGDGEAQDVINSRRITQKLREKDANGNALIDMVLVVINGGSKDLSSTYQLINEVVIPNMGDRAASRIIVAINQADQAMSGRDWDFETNEPKEGLLDYLNTMTGTVRDRIKSSTDVDIEPIFYCAGYRDKTEVQQPYNITKLLSFILQYVPISKRIVVIEQSSKESRECEYGQNVEDDVERIEKSLAESVLGSAAEGALVGAAIGKCFGSVGVKFGTVAGAIVGGFLGLFR